MKARIAHVLETINGQSRLRQNEVQLHTLQSRKSHFRARSKRKGSRNRKAAGESR